MATTAQAGITRWTHTSPSFKRVLCAIDFSGFSARAVTDAVAVARASKGGITALFVFPLVPQQADDALGSVGPRVVDAGARSVVAEDLEDLLRPARAAGVPVRISIRAGEPAQEILAEAQATQADVIVMGTHGRSGLKRWVLGSVTDQVLRKAPCPLLTSAHPDEESSLPGQAGIARIVCAVDLSPSSARTLEHALSLRRMAGVPLTVLHVVDAAADEASLALYGVSNRSLRAEAEARARLHELVPEADRRGGQIEEVVVTGRRYREILGRADEEAAGLIVIGSRAAGPVGRVVCGSTTDRIIRGASCAVLTVTPVPGVGES